MKRVFLILSLTVLGVTTLLLVGQVASKQSGIESRLALALKLFPDERGEGG